MFDEYRIINGSVFLFFFLIISGAPTMLSDMDELPFIKLGEDDVLRFELDPLTAVGKEVALRELRETPENKAQALVELRTLLQGNIQTQPRYAANLRE